MAILVRQVKGLLRREVTTDTMFKPTGQFPVAVFITEEERQRLSNHFKGGTWYFINSSTVKGFNGKEWGYVDGNAKEFETLESHYMRMYGKHYV